MAQGDVQFSGSLVEVTATVDRAVVVPVIVRQKDEVGARVRHDEIAGEHERIAHGVRSVALPLVRRDPKDRRAPRIRHDLDCALIVVVVIAVRLLLECRIAAHPAVEATQEFPAALDGGEILLAGSERGDVRRGVHMKRRVGSREEARTDQADLRKRVEPNEGRQRIGLLPPRCVFVGDHRAHRGQLGGERRVVLVPGLHVVLSAPVLALPRRHRPEQGILVAAFLKFRIQTGRPLAKTLDGLCAEVFRGPRPLLEVPSVDVGLAALEHHEDAESRLALGGRARAGFRSRLHQGKQMVPGHCDRADSHHFAARQEMLLESSHRNPRAFSPIEQEFELVHENPLQILAAAFLPTLAEQIQGGP